jgi:peroxiredoxin (alkyl hydroperoxide reductase subunit C)
MTVLAAGTPAPSVTLARGDGQSFTEKDLKGQRTVLVFYPFAFSPCVHRSAAAL